MKRRIISMTVVALAVSLLAGCNNDNDRLTRAKLVAKAEATCKGVNDKLDNIFLDLFGADFSHRPTAAELHAALSKAVPLLEGARSDLEDLTPPESDEAKYDAFTAALGKAIAEIKALDARAAKDDDAVVDDFFAHDPFEEVNQKASDLGLKECGDEDEDDGEEESSPDAPSDEEKAAFSQAKKDFIAAADAICKRGNEQLEAITGPLFVPGGPRVGEAPALLEPVVKVSREIASGVRGLTPPPGEEEHAKAVFDQFDGAVAILDTALGVAKGGDQDAFYEALLAAFSALDESNNAAAAYGFVDCSQ